MKTTQERIDYLKKCADLYETNGSSPISDYEYDKEYDALKELDPDNAFFSEVGGIEEELVFGEKVKHEIIMGSLNKDPNIETFQKWLENTYKDKEKDFISGKLSFILQYKIDGLSLSCLYKNGKLVQCLTRGDGQTGVNVYENCLYINDIPKKIECKKDVEIRGEVYKDREDFQKYFKDSYKNERNFASGSLNQKNAKTTGERELDFIAYEVVRKEFETEEDKIAFLKNYGFKTISTTYKKVFGNFKNMVSETKTYMESIDRSKLPYEIDGIVVKLNQIDVAQEMGSVSDGRKPKSNRAIKFPCDQKETQLLDFEYGIGRTGNFTIVGILKPVELAGTTVSRVTLHNIKFIQEMDIKIGCTLLIQKSGDIIPYVVRKTKDQPIDNQPNVWPSKCPSCDNKLEWDDNKVTLHCDNYNCPSQFSQRIENWFKTIGVMGLGEGIIQRLLQLCEENKPIVSSIADMYKLRDHVDILTSEFGPKASQNILNSIESVREITLEQLMEAIGISKIGSMAKEIVKIAPSLNELDLLTIEKLLEINGFAEIKARCFIDGWKKVRKEVNETLEYIKIKEKEMKSKKLDGQSFCITGTLSMPRNEFQVVIESNGGKFASGVSSKLNYLICGEECGSKKDKAEKCGVKIISEKEFLDMLE